jgi:hypothetical protein
MIGVDNVLAVLAGLGGLGAFISMVVNILKMVGVVEDGTSEQWVKGFNLVAFVGVSVVMLFNVPVDWGIVDNVMMFLITLGGFVIQLFGSKITYAVTRGLPLIGFSFNTEE